MSTGSTWRYSGQFMELTDGDYLTIGSGSEGYTCVVHFNDRRFRPDDIPWDFERIDDPDRIRKLVMACWLNGEHRNGQHWTPEVWQQLAAGKIPAFLRKAT